MNRYIPGYSNFLEQCWKKAIQRSQVRQRNFIEEINALPPEKMEKVKEFVNSMKQ